MEYIIVRAEKYAGRGEIRAMVKHALREVSCQGADPALSHQNIVAGPRTSDAFFEILDEKLSGVRRYRSDSPTVIEILVGTSPDFASHGGDDKKLFAGGRRFLEETFGAENVLLETRHYDETSPHQSIFVCPIVDNPEIAEYEHEQAIGISGRLVELPNADGEIKTRRRKYAFTARPPESVVLSEHYLPDRAAYRKFQTDFYEAVGRNVGLARGEEGSKAVHVDMKTWRQAMSKAAAGELPDIPQPGPQDHANPVKYFAKIHALALDAWREANLVRASAVVEKDHVKDTTRRLNAWSKRLDEQSLRQDAIASQAAASEKARDALLQVVAQMIMSTQSAVVLEPLCADIIGPMPLSNKYDLYHKIVRAGGAETLVDAVLLVAERINASGLRVEPIPIPAERPAPL